MRVCVCVRARVCVRVCCEMQRVSDVMLPSCCLWLNFRLWTERTDMPDEEVGSREAKHNLLLHSQDGGREGVGTRGEKPLKKQEDVLFYCWLC